MFRVPVRSSSSLRARLRRAAFVVAGAWALLSAGCHSGAPNPFQTGATRVPPPPTRATNAASGYLPGTPGAAPAAVPGAIGTGVPGSASNWSSNPSSVATANSGGIYTSYLERNGSGYVVRSVPSGGTTTPEASGGTSTATKNPFPQTPNPNTRSSVDGDSRFPTTPVDANAVQPATFQQPTSVVGSSSFDDAGSPPPPPPPTNLQWRTPPRP